MISVIICTYNRDKYIYSCLQKIADNGYPTQDYEIILVNNNSTDNTEQIHHFTKENSSLLSNSILSIAINHATGEVYFGTDMGLCSYMANATAPSDEMHEDDVYAYPNPEDSYQ